MSDKFGGPAFPDPARAHPHGTPADSPDCGMQIWDYYAAAAMTGLTGSAFKYLSEADTEDALTEEAHRMLNDIGAVAGKVADKMLAERAKREAGDE